MKKITKRIMAFMLSLVMMLGCIPSNIAHAERGYEIELSGSSTLTGSKSVTIDGCKVDVNATVEDIDDEDSLKSGDSIEFFVEFHTSLYEEPIVELEFEPSYNDCMQPMKIDVTIQFSDEYQNLFNTLSDDLMQLYFADNADHAITDVDLANKKISFTTCFGGVVNIGLYSLRATTQYTNFREITDINEFENGKTYAFFSVENGKLSSTDLIEGITGNSAVLKVLDKFIDDNDFLNWPTVLQDWGDMGFDGIEYIFDLDNFNGYLKDRVDVDYYPSLADFETHMADLKTNGTNSQYFNFYNGLYNDNLGILTSYFRLTNDQLVEDISKRCKIFSILHDISLKIDNEEITSIDQIEFNGFTGKKAIITAVYFAWVAADLNDVQGIVDVIVPGDDFDDCTSGVIGYDDTEEHWWYACINGGAGQGSSDFENINTVGAGYFYAYSYDLEKATVTINYKGQPINDKEFHELNPEDFEVTITKNGVTEPAVFKLADPVVNSLDKMVTISIYKDADDLHWNDCISDLFNYSFEKKSSGSSKKYKATDDKDTTEKITGTGKKGSTRTIIPEEGKKVTDVIVKDKDGNEIEVTMNEDGTYSFKQPASNVTVEVLYEALTPEEEMQAKLMKDDVKKANSNEGAKINPNAKFVKGYEDGTFKPNKEVSNLELMCMVTQLFEDTAQLNAKEEINLNQGDNEWAGNVAALANGLGLIPGNKNDKNYDLNSNVTRGDLAVVIYNLIKDYTPCDKLVDSDNCKDAVGKDYEEAVAKLVSLGILKGYDDGLFHGDNTLTRAEAVVVINRALISLGFEIKIDSLKVSFPDLSQSHWAYDEIMFAANK